MASNRKNDFDLKWAKLISEQQAKTENPPIGKGWMTTKEFGEKFKIGHVRAQRYIGEGVKKGLIQKHQGSKKNKEGRVVRGTWYRPK